MPDVPPQSIEYSKVHISALAVAVIVQFVCPHEASVHTNDNVKLFAVLSTTAVAVASHHEDVPVTR